MSSLSARELLRQRDHTFPPRRAPRPADMPALAPEGDLAATRLWLGHVEAGRIGVPAPPPASTELRLASLAAILGPRRARIW